MPDFATSRRQMVDTQLRTNDVTDHGILDAFGAVPREAFVPDRLKPLAYIDEHIEVAPGRFVTQPHPLGKLIQLGEPRKTDKALVVGAATGYATALLADLVQSVVALEEDPALAAEATATLGRLAIDNAKVATGALAAGWPAGAPYDLILMDGSVELIPDALVAQLADRGRLVTVVGRGLAGRATIMTRSGTDVGTRTAFNCNVKPLPGFARPKEFVF